MKAARSTARHSLLASCFACIEELDGATSDTGIPLGKVVALAWKMESHSS